MRNDRKMLIIILTLMIWGITFKADTQREPQMNQADRKFKIAIKVESADVFSKLHTEIHIKNELLKLGDVDIIPHEEPEIWEDIIFIHLARIIIDVNENGKMISKPGDIIICSSYLSRINDSYTTQEWNEIPTKEKPVLVLFPFSGYTQICSPHELESTCKRIVLHFNSVKLQIRRNPIDNQPKGN